MDTTAGLDFPPGFLRAYRAIHEVGGRRRGPAPKVGVAHHLRIIEPERPHALTDRLGAWLLRRGFNDGFACALTDGAMYGPLDALLAARTGFHARDAKGIHDFLGVNYYSRDVVRFSAAAHREMFVRRGVPAGAETSDLGWEIYPEGLGRVLRAWTARAGVPAYVTENGLADATDRKRPGFLVRHLREVALAIADGVDVRGYFHWSLLDNFEWAEGYAPRFGLVEVDYRTLARTPRPSARLYANIARTRRIGEAADVK